MTLNHNGLIYIIVGDNTVWTRAPLISEIKSGSGPGGSPPVFYKILAYKTSVSTSGNMAWTSMPQGSFTMYVVGSDDNPFDTANFGVIKSFKITN